MAGRDRQITARQVVDRLQTFKRHLIDLIVAAETEDTAIYAKALLMREATDALIAEYAAILDYPPPATLPSTAHFLREKQELVEDGE